METSSQRVSLLSSSTVYMVSGDLEMGNAEIRTIDQLTSAGEVGSFWVLATVCSIETEHKWWYLSCKRCPKKVNCVGTRFYCEKCDRFDNSGHPRLNVVVGDGGGGAASLAV
ncbi:unnamed protein product [Fraxinus pennsylvanica]|uniref:Replication factor A C-terminal domain-containing protein n=1 Tax=Fraxinus pennsylvanica TaxID=56036 RepID=A0AAD2ABM7_9LAMI|nr:unnamed protein product [Fraxinus pennsylvanica]